MSPFDFAINFLFRIENLYLVSNKCKSKNNANTIVIMSSGRDKIFFNTITFSELELELFKNESDCNIFKRMISYIKLATIERIAMIRPGEKVKSGSFNEKMYKPNRTIIKDKSD